MCDLIGNSQLLSICHITWNLKRGKILNDPKETFDMTLSVLNQLRTHRFAPKWNSGFIDEKYASEWIEFCIVTPGRNRCKPYNNT